MSVEDKYKKMTTLEHILARPEMYIGPVQELTDDAWVMDEADNMMKQRKCTWIPGLYKIFDEIIVNAADNKIRDFENQNRIKVWIDEAAGKVSVYNNGEGIPVVIHKEHHMYVPEMIFGHLLTSSNYNDNEAKVTGGRNGYGAKLTNVFSKQFELETVHRGKKFSMKWTNNMTSKSEPKITTVKEEDYTKVTFYPDFARFNVSGFGEDLVLLMKRRAYDLAGCTDKSMKVYLNDQRLPISTFAEYVDLFPTMGEEKKAASYAKVNERWEVCVRVSNIGYQQMSFVNSIATSRGGTHVKYITEQIIAKITDASKKKKGDADVKPHMIKPHLFVFINCLIENPGFDSQTKETLNTTKARFGSSCELPKSMVDYILRSGIVERTLATANSKLTKELASKVKNSDRRQILGIPKLDDANEAGGKNSYRCTLILTEGDSAKALCTAGLAVKDRDFFGVFPLRGKPLNVRDASLKKVMGCEEIQSVMKILGLDIRQKYTTTDGLRYGHLMIMSDQDHDGSHIKGLIINMIHHYWPDLIRVPGFLQQFITPIVKARPKGRNADNHAISFFSMPHYLEWKAQQGSAASGYDIRYYKGLGTSGAKEGREYFENIDRHRLDFVHRTPRDDERIVMAFSKDKVDERKQWITAFRSNINPNESMDYSIKKVPFSDFIDKELILFSVADCERSIPSVVDGLKPGQRKILFACFKRNLTKSIKVVQLAGYVSEHAAYHHGEMSLVSTIVALAQDFVGSNNVPLLHQDGQFGTRLQGGKDHAAGRYIFTRLTHVARLLFHRADDYTVDYRDDDGLSVEPFYYVPVIPLVLVNGTAGIGTGFATSIPNYSPIDVIRNLRHLINGEELEPMKPWYFGFKGDIEEKEKGKFVARGVCTIKGDNLVCITELPVGTWTQHYKKFLEDLREKEIVVQYREYNTDVTVDFEVLIHPEVLQQWVAQGVVEDRLQLKEYVHATNIIAFNQQGQLTKYSDAEAVMKEFYLIRVDYYCKRKEHLLGDLRRTVSKLENMVRFVRDVVSGAIVVTKRKKKDLLDELKTKQYHPFPPAQKKKISATTIEAEEGGAAEELNGEQPEHEDIAGALLRDDANGADAGLAKDYDYLLGMRLWNLTAEMIARLEAQMKKAQDELKDLLLRSPKSLWLDDLNALEAMIKKTFFDREKEIESIQRKKQEKKRPFDTRNVRVPILSDKARKALEKTAPKATAGGASRSNNNNAALLGEDGLPIPKKKRAPAKRKRKNSSDEDNYDDTSSSEDDPVTDDDDEDEPLLKKATAAASSVGKPKAKPAAKRSKAQGSSSKKKPKKKKRGSDSDEDSDEDSSDSESSARPSSSSEDEPEDSEDEPLTKRKPPAKRAASKAAPRAVKASPVVTVDADDDVFDLDSFGLSSLTPTTPAAVKAPPSPAKPRAVAAPPKPASVAAAAVRPTSLIDAEEDEDDLFLITGGKKANPPAAAAPAKKATAAPATKKTPSAAPPKKAPAKRKRRRGSDSESSESSSSSSSDSSDYDFSD